MDDSKGGKGFGWWSKVREGSGYYQKRLIKKSNTITGTTAKLAAGDRKCPNWKN